MMEVRGGREWRCEFIVVLTRVFSHAGGVRFFSGFDLFVLL